MVAAIKDKILFLSAIWILAGCGDAKMFQQASVSNPKFVPNRIFVNYEDASYPMFKHIREKYGLDTVCHGETDEFKRILLLRHWIHENIPLTPDGVVVKAEDNTAESILDDALKGSSFHCAYFMIVHTEVMNACGYSARVINADEGELNLPHQIAHHGTNEVWSNTFHKWFFSDAMFDCHFEKDGIPLSALEIRDEYLKNRSADIVMVYGPERNPIDLYPDKNERTKEIFSRVFTWIAWFKQSDIYSNWDNGVSYLIMYQDDYFKEHKWIRVDGKPHWAYGSKYLIISTDRSEIYWTPNTITSKVDIARDSATVTLESITPFLSSYQMREKPDGEWRNVPASVVVKLESRRNELTFRTINLQGVTGAEHAIIIEQ